MILYMYSDMVNLHLTVSETFDPDDLKYMLGLYSLFLTFNFFKTTIDKLAFSPLDIIF